MIQDKSTTVTFSIQSRRVYEQPRVCTVKVSKEANVEDVLTVMYESLDGFVRDNWEELRR